MKVYHISDNDLDGVSALHLSQTAFENNELTTIASNTRSIDEMVRSYVENKWEKDTLFIITDLSIVSKELADKIDQKVKKGYLMVLIDHHPTAYWLNDYSWATVINEEDGIKTSATSMYLRYLKEHHGFQSTPTIEDYVELVRQYDTWDWWNEGIVKNGERVPNYRSKRLNDLLYIVGKKEFEQLVLSKLKEKQERFTLDEKAEYLLDIEQHRIKEYIERKQERMKILPFTLQEREYTMAVLTAENYHSELGNVICQEHEAIDFVAICDVGRQKISFRARKPDVDVSLIAKHYGGGGHAPASGCSLDANTIPVFLEPLMEKGTLKSRREAKIEKLIFDLSQQQKIGNQETVSIDYVLHCLESEDY